MDNLATTVDELAIDGVFNFRDLGGLRTTDGGVTLEGRIFRADGLHRASAQDAERIVALGIRQVIDLRTINEVEGEGHFEQPGATYTHIPIVQAMSGLRATIDPTHDNVLRGHYRHLLDRNGEAFARALILIADSIEADQPVVFHCTAGKDRTGVLSALLLCGVGVGDAAVAADYARSAQAIDRMIAWYRLHADATPQEKMADMGLDPQMAEAMMGAEAETMHNVLADLRSSHGSIGDYLAQLAAADAAARIGARFVNR